MVSFEKNKLHLCIIHLKIQSNLPKRQPAINDHFYSPPPPPRQFILNILTGFNDHLHNATNNRQNAFPNDHFNFFQRPLSLLHDELTTKMGKLTGNVPQRSHSFSVYTNRCIRLDGLAARCSGRPKLPRQFVPVRNFEPWLFVPMPGNMGRPAFTFINLYIFL